jgi:hypothetical protein
MISVTSLRDPMQPVTVGFTQSLNITSLLLQLTKPFCNKEISDLNIQEKWCFMDKQRFDNFAEQTTLQPLENRTLEENGSKNSIFEEKQEVYSTLFWLTHWAMRQGNLSFIFIERYLTFGVIFTKLYYTLLK